jgi:hypothetical protein
MAFFHVSNTGEFVGVYTVGHFDPGLAAMLMYETKSVSDRWPNPAVAWERHDGVGNKVSKRTHPEAYSGDLLGPGFCWLTLSRRAVDVLRPLLECYGEILPMRSSQAPVSRFHCTNVIDAIVPAKSEVVGTRIDRYCFRREVVSGQAMFRPSFPVSNLIVGDEFRNAVIANGLRGFEFQPLDFLFEDEWRDPESTVQEPT